MQGLIEKWDYIEGKICALLLGAAVSLAFYEVISRYFFHFSVDWSSELTLYAIAWCTMFGSSGLIKRDEHVKVTVLFHFLSEERGNVLNFLNTIVSLMFTVVVAYSAVLQVHEAYISGIISESSLRMPHWVVYLVMPIGCALFTLRLAERLNILRKKIRAKQVVTDPLFFAYILFGFSLWFLFRMEFTPSLILGFGLLVLLILGVPIAFALGFVSLNVLYFMDLLPVSGVSPKMFESIT